MKMKGKNKSGFIGYFTIVSILVTMPLIHLSAKRQNLRTAARQVSIIPYPKEITIGHQLYEFTDQYIIQLKDLELKPIADIFSQNVAKLTGIKLGINTRPQSDKVISLFIDPELKKNQHIIDIRESIIIKGGSKPSLTNGCYSFLQILGPLAKNLTLPHLSLLDWPDRGYCGLMIDLARNWHSPETVKKLIELAAFYKLNHVQLHFTDYQSYTLPSKHMPELSTKDRHYTFKELQAFEEYGMLRGISIIPELDVPGHAKAMIMANPKLFGIKDISENPYTINMGKEEVYRTLDILIRELVQIFKTSKYFHIGGDEAILNKFNEDPDVQRYMRTHQLGSDVHDLYRHFILRLTMLVKKHGKILCVWEGFKKYGKIKIPKDIIVYEYETAYYLPCDLIRDGYTVVNASWKPLYVVREKKWSPEYIFRWNLWRWENWFHKAPSFSPIQCEPSLGVIGGQMCAWEQTQELEIPSLRRRLPAFAERVWTPNTSRSLADFLARLEETDRVLSKLIDDSRQDNLPAFGK